MSVTRLDNRCFLIVGELACELGGQFYHYVGPHWSRGHVSIAALLQGIASD